MTPTEVRGCTMRELHHYIQDWAQAEDHEETEWVD